MGFGDPLLRLHDHQVILTELVLTQREQHLDEQTVGGGAIGDDDRLGTGGIQAFRFTNCPI
jgi:hypothetical protein